MTVHWTSQCSAVPLDQLPPAPASQCQPVRQTLELQTTFCFSRLLGLFPSGLSASPLLSGVSTRHSAPPYILSLPGQRASPHLEQRSSSSEGTSTSIALTGQARRRREPYRSPTGDGKKLALNIPRVTRHVCLSRACQQIEKTRDARLCDGDLVDGKSAPQQHSHLKLSSVKLHTSIPCCFNSFLTAASSVALLGNKRELVMLLPSAIHWPLPQVLL